MFLIDLFLQNDLLRNNLRPGERGALSCFQLGVDRFGFGAAALGKAPGLGSPAALREV